nr:PREDICTED: protein-tyrosine kinase 6-like [Paralichthys olivaceus]
MGECLRRVCPCLETLWQRSSGEKKPSAGGGGGGGDGSGEDRPPQDKASESSSVYTAVWPFEARHEDELSFQEGDLFCVTSRTGDWWTARKVDKDGRVLDTGIVPNNYLVRAESLKVQPLNNVQGTVELTSPLKQDEFGQREGNKKPDTPDLNHFTVDEWELPKEDFTLEEELGTGFFADVYRGRWKNHINVAIKIIKSDSELNHREFQREVQILKSLRHRHLISLFAVCTASSPYYIITELMEKGSLLTFLRGPEGALQDTAALIDMGAQVADGMLYLEEQNSIHRDLAARNVLVGGDYICKVADFGLARVIKEPFYISEDKKIPYKWCAPEAISHGKFSNKSDVWSFGVLLYEITTYGGIPYPALSNQEVFQQVTKGYRMPAPPKCPDVLYRIMLQCWSHEPDERPLFKSLKVQLDGGLYEM